MSIYSPSSDVDEARRSQRGQTGRQCERDGQTYNASQHRSSPSRTTVSIPSARPLCRLRQREAPRDPEGGTDMIMSRTMSGSMRLRSSDPLSSRQQIMRSLWSYQRQLRSSRTPRRQTDRLCWSHLDAARQKKVSLLCNGEPTSSSDERSAHLDPLL